MANGVTMTAINQLRGVQERLNRLGYHLRHPGTQSAGVDNAPGAATERAVLAFQADYRPGLPASPPARLQVRGEWTNNTAAQYQNNLNAYNQGTATANPSAADSALLQTALVAYVGA
jgi:peptidoglycan hydrolase-like protein with peptidoglycan-binding domain